MSEALVNPDRKITVDIQDALTSRIDFYKPNMSQLAYEQHGDAQVTFTFKDRGNIPLAEYVNRDEIAERFDQIITEGFDASEVDYLRTIPNPNKKDEQLYSEKYLGYLAASKLPEVQVERRDNTLNIHSTGEWPLVTYAETAVMGEVTEMYFYNYLKAKNIDVTEVWAEGDRRLSEKIAMLKAHPEIKLMEFGTRRHFSVAWHQHVLERLLTECPENILGTSNLFMADYYGIKPMGTSAHEMDMGYGGLAGDDDELLARMHGTMLDDWYARYGARLTTALTDTYGAKFFFDDLGEERAQKIMSYRQDSGDPFEFGQYALDRLKQLNVDPREKTFIFSDGLDIPTCIKLYERYGHQANVVFGVGTDLTNDLGLKALNIVMKLTAINGRPTVKLSDFETKATGPEDEIERYRRVFGYVPLSQAVLLG